MLTMWLMVRRRLHSQTSGLALTCLAMTIGIGRQQHKLRKSLHKATVTTQLTDTDRLYPISGGHRGYLDLDRRPLLDAEDDELEDE